MVKELIESFVDADFAGELDFSIFEPQREKSYLTEEMKEYAEDLLILEYLKEHPQATKLPSLLPILLYNGKGPWEGAENIRDLFEDHPFLQSYYPDFRYFKIIERDFTVEELEEIGNAVAGVFMVENADKQEMENTTSRLGEILDGESAEIIALLAVWLKHLLRNERIGKELFQEAVNIRNTKEAKGMLVETIAELKKDWLEQGMRNTAIRLLDMGLLVEQISQATGMTPQEIEALNKK